MTLPAPTAALASERLAATDKGLPTRAAGLTVAEFLATGPRLAEFWTPLLVLDAEAIDHNLATMRRWCADRGLELMPHGKTTMSPQLWQRHLDAGAAGITLATIGQIRTARAFGIETLMLANEPTDRRGLEFIAAELADERFSFTCWADSVEAVELMESALMESALMESAPARPVNVCVELGSPGARTGARTAEEARRIAERIHASAVLRLAGVAGYEGALAHDRSEPSLTAVRAYLDAMVALHASLYDLYDDGELILTAGGSAYFDLVHDAFSPADTPMARTRYVLRSGAYLTHDSGFYRSISPLDPTRGTPEAAGGLRAGMHGVARVTSRPEPTLALLDAGKRDFPLDEGLPTPQALQSDLGADAGQPAGSVGSAGSDDSTAARVTAMNDQHTFVTLPADADAPVGSVVRLGLSHPCTAFDKWRFIPVVESARNPRVVDLVRTFF